MESLKFLVNGNRIWLYGFVIMPNHIHLMWCKQDEWVESSEGRVVRLAGAVPLLVSEVLRIEHQ